MLELKQRDVKALDPVSVGYCEMQTLLNVSGKNRLGCVTSKSYGWLCDVYLIDGVYITTGYAPIGETIKGQYELINKYEEKAKVIKGDYSLNLEVRSKKIDRLLSKLLKELMKLKNA